MRIGFYLDTEEPEFMGMARAAIAAVRKHMPLAEVVHLTTPAGPTLLEADREFRCEASGPVWYRRVLVQAKAPVPMLFLDVDVLMQRGVPELWSLGADVALPEVADPFVRYTGGVVYAAHRAFWQGWSQDAVWAAGEGVRPLLQAFTAYVDRFAGNVVRLNESTYERLATANAKDYESAALVHFRGPRKRWFPVG